MNNDFEFKGSEQKDNISPSLIKSKYNFNISGLDIDDREQRRNQAMREAYIDVLNARHKAGLASDTLATAQQTMDAANATLVKAESNFAFLEASSRQTDSC